MNIIKVLYKYRPVTNLKYSMKKGKLNILMETKCLITGK